MTQNTDTQSGHESDAEPGGRDAEPDGRDAQPRDHGQRDAEPDGGADAEPAVSRRARRPALPVATVVRDGETVAASCPHCGQPFPDERARDLHVGEAHPDDCTDPERASYDAASDAETDDLFYFHLRVVAALGVLYGFVVLVYMVALGSGFL